MIGAAKKDLLKRVMAGEAIPQNRAERRVVALNEAREARRGRRARARVERALAAYPEAVAA